jgi:hypothetical protein
MPTVRTRLHRSGLRAALLTVVGALALGLGGCGQNTSGGAPSTSGSPSGSATSAPGTTPSPTGKPAPTPSSTALPKHQEVSVTGQIVEGLRPQCVMLQTANRRYVLTGKEAARLRTGQHVAVVGVPRPDLLSPCGAILVVSSVTVR